MPASSWSSENGAGKAPGREVEMATTETATLGGGCFWCLEPLFDSLEGVDSVESGYSGGHVENPSYRQVCTGTTGHAEVIRIAFDPERISYRDLLEVFFSAHDPTTRDRQGNDVGPQYRSVIYFHSPEQERTAREVVAEAGESGEFRDPIVTEITPFERFYEAEDYHQEYFERNPDQAYCRAVIAPKVSKFRKAYGERLRK
jgi:peptide-methionine (S)-S-oxide reductase